MRPAAPPSEEEFQWAWKIPKCRAAVAKALREARESAALGQREVLDALAERGARGYSEPSLSGLETGRHQSYPLFRLLYDYFELDWRKILHRSFFAGEVIAPLYNDPDVETFLIATSTPEFYHGKTYGEVVELRRYWQPSSKLMITGLQSDSKLITVAKGGRFQFPIPDPPLHGTRPHMGDDRTKFKLADYAPKSGDEGTGFLHLAFETCKYWEWRDVIDQYKLPTNAPFKARYAHPEPAKHMIPNGFCAHTIVQFSDGRFLCLWRSPENTAFEQDTISFGVDEQMDIKDFDSVEFEPIDSLCRRVVLEEVFPHRQLSVDDKRAKEFIERYVAKMNVLSLFFDYRYGSHCLCVFIGLSVNEQKFKDLVLEILTENETKIQENSGRDKEGYLYTTGLADVQNFFETARMRLSNMWSGEWANYSVPPQLTMTAQFPAMLHEKRAHFSSFYRMHIVARSSGFQNETILRRRRA